MDQEFKGWDQYIGDQLKVLKERHRKLKAQVEDLENDIREGESFLDEGDEPAPPAKSQGQPKPQKPGPRRAGA